MEQKVTVFYRKSYHIPWLIYSPDCPLGYGEVPEDRDLFSFLSPSSTQCIESIQLFVSIMIPILFKAKIVSYILQL